MAAMAERAGQALGYRFVGQVETGKPVLFTLLAGLRWGFHQLRAVKDAQDKGSRVDASRNGP